MIRKTTMADCRLLAGIIRRSFFDVAERFSLTKENCPTHPSNCTTSWVKSDMARGVEYFVLSHGGNPIGFAAIESQSKDKCYMERLSVLPEMPGRHFGIRLVERALDCAASKGAAKVGIGIISEHPEPKDRYRALGFWRLKHGEFAISRLTYAFWNVIFGRLQNGTCTGASDRGHFRAGAVMGHSTRWKVSEGISFQALFERTGPAHQNDAAGRMIWRENGLWANDRTVRP